MTHPDLVLRAEQAVLASALRDPQHLDDVAYLTPDRMAHPTHRAILSALNESRTSDPTVSAAELPELIARRVVITGVDADYLRRLADSARQPRNIAGYARLVQEAAVRRDLVRHADQLRTTATEAGDPDLELARLTQALRLNEHPAPVSKFDEPAPAPYESRARTDVRLDGRDRVLAALLQQPKQIREVSTWLSPEAFEAGPRRDVYEAVVAVAERGEPVDQLTVEWEIYRRDPRTYEVVAEVDFEDRPGYLTGLATAAVAGAAVELAAKLLAEDIRAKLAADFGEIEAAAPAPGAAPEAHPKTGTPTVTPQLEPAPPLQPPPVQQPPTANPNIRP